VTDELPLPETLTLDEAYRAAFFLVDAYISVEANPDEGLVLFHQYMQSDPARWEDWRESIRIALRSDANHDPLRENLKRD